MTARRKPRQPGIKWKLFAYLAAFAVVILVILWLFQIVFLSDIYKLIRIADVRIAAHTLTDAIDEVNFANLANETARRNQICLIVLRMDDDDTAVEIVSVETQQFCLIHNTDRAAKFTIYDLAKKNGGSVMRRYRIDARKQVFYQVEDGLFSDEPDAEESILYAALTENDDGETFLLLLNAVVTPVNATLRTLNAQLSVISVVLLLLALLLAFLISRRVSRPIIRINESAKQLATGDYDVTFEGGSYREITELAETMNYAAVELSKVESLRRELIANISHDLRTPLTMIEGYGEVMRDLPGENTPENVQIIIDEAKRLSSLVNDLLDLSRIQSGVVQFEMQPVDLTGLITETLARFNKLLEADGYQVFFTPVGHASVMGDSTRLTQVIFNLVNNAVTYTGADKRILVRQTIRDGRVRISVTDTGEGIPPDKLDMIWDRYYKGDKAHRRASVGTGLGLSIVKSIVEAHGGQYGVESTLGEGSTFWVEFDTVNAEAPYTAP